MSMVRVRARIRLAFLPRNWKRVVAAAAERCPEDVCRLAPANFKISDGLVYDHVVGNGCVDYIIDQLHMIADALGAELTVETLDA